MDKLEAISLDHLASASGGQQAVQDLTAGQIVDVARMGGCLDAVYQAGMARGREGYTADNRLLQPSPIPGQISRGTRLNEAALACKLGGGF